MIRTNDAIAVGPYLDRWLSVVSVRPKTKRSPEQVVRLYLKPSLGPVRLSRLEADQVRALVQGLEKRGLSTRTATLARDVLRIALAQAVSDELISRNVAALVRRPKPRRSEGLTLSNPEARVLLDALQGHRLEAVVTCGMALGLRLGEVLGLEWSAVDLKAGRVTVRTCPANDWETTRVGRPEVTGVTANPRLAVTHGPHLGAPQTLQAERRLAAGSDWQRSDFVFTTRAGRPLDGTLITRDLKALLARTWTGGRDTCKHERERDRSASIAAPGVSRSSASTV